MSCCYRLRGSSVSGMPAAPGAAAPARDAVTAFIAHLAAQGMSAATLRARRHFLDEYLRHAHSQRADGAGPLSPGELTDPARSPAWLADAPPAKTRVRNTTPGPAAPPYP